MIFVKGIKSSPPPGLKNANIAGGLNRTCVFSVVVIKSIRYFMLYGPNGHEIGYNINILVALEYG